MSILQPTFSFRKKKLQKEAKNVPFYRFDSSAPAKTSFASPSGNFA
jgi:hypothetical protein